MSENNEKQAEREAFEAWAKGEVDSLKKGNNGGYLYADATLAWKAWQACATLVPAAPVAQGSYAMPPAEYVAGYEDGQRDQLAEACHRAMSDADIDKIAETMPGGMDGFLKGWGWRQFARAVEGEIVSRTILAQSAPRADHSGDSAGMVASGDVWERFAAWLVDHCEGQVITEEFLHVQLGKMLATEAFAAPSAAQQAAAICEACNGSGEGYAGSVCGHCLGRGEFLAEAMPDYKVRFETMVSMIGEISDALGIPDDEAACANGNDLILSAISQLRAPSAISHQEKLARFYPDFAAGIMRESTRGAWVRYVAAPSASAQQAEPVANNEAYDLAYDKIDRFLRSNLDDDDYAEFSRALDSLFAAPAPTQDTQVEPLPACRPGRWRDGDACEPAVPAPSASVQYAKREDAPYAPLPVPSASPAALTERALIDAANARADLYEGDDRPCIKTDVMNAFYAGAEFAMRALLAASPADRGEDARIPGRVDTEWHDLKADAHVFEEVITGRKASEIRFDDRGYQVGHVLRLRETRHTGAEMKAGAPLEYTGREAIRVVSHIQRGYGLGDGWVCLSFDAAMSASKEEK